MKKKVLFIILAVVITTFMYLFLIPAFNGRLPLDSDKSFIEKVDLRKESDFQKDFPMDDEANLSAQSGYNWNALPGIKKNGTPDKKFNSSELSAEVTASRVKFDLKKNSKTNVHLVSKVAFAVKRNFRMQIENIYRSLFTGRTTKWAENSAILRNNLNIVEDVLRDKLCKIKLLEGGRVFRLEPEAYLEHSIPELRSLNAVDFKKFYVFDEFNDSCSHGKKVLDVIRQTLNTYKLDSAFSNVIIMPVNYFSNITQGNLLYEKYCDSYLANDNCQVINPEIVKEKSGSNEYVPSAYLNAIYTLAVDDEPDIISSSFVIEGQDAFMRNAFTQKNQMTNFFAAALNDPMDLDSLVKVVRSGFGRKNASSYLEPLFSYQSALGEEGVIIVGNLVKKETYRGMYSKTGKKVSVLGRGIHWGQKGFTSCIDSVEDVGTSFATPEVATKMFIAKAMWRKKGEIVSALEARNRMVLATNLEPGLVGKFASAGAIDMKKLIQYHKGYLVTNQDEVIVIDSLYGQASMSYEGESLEQKILSPVKVSAIRSLYLSAGKTYVLRNSENCCWEKYKEPTYINLVFRIKDETMPKVINKEEFYRDYKQFVILK